MLMTVDGYCELVYPDFRKNAKSVKAKRDTVSKMCRDGTLKGKKAGKRWLIEL